MSRTKLIIISILMMIITMKVEPFQQVGQDKKINLEIVDSTYLANFDIVKKEVGVASFYGKTHHGRRTASGERFDMNKHTAAHKKLKFGTIVRVVNLKNGKWTLVKINDRGPFIKGRIIDLAQAPSFDIDNRGIVQCSIEVLELRPIIGLLVK